MEFSPLIAFQNQLFSALSDSETISEAVGTAIYDAPPVISELPEIYLQIGDYVVRSASSKTHQAREVLFDVSVFARAAAFLEQAKIVCEVQEVVLSSPKLLMRNFHPQFKRSQSTRMNQGELKRVQLRFNTFLDLS